MNYLQYSPLLNPTSFGVPRIPGYVFGGDYKSLDDEIGQLLQQDNVKSTMAARDAGLELAQEKAERERDEYERGLKEQEEFIANLEKLGRDKALEASADTPKEMMEYINHVENLKKLEAQTNSANASAARSSRRDTQIVGDQLIDTQTGATIASGLPVKRDKEKTLNLEDTVTGMPLFGVTADQANYLNQKAGAARFIPYSSKKDDFFSVPGPDGKPTGGAGRVNTVPMRTVTTSSGRQVLLPETDPRVQEFLRKQALGSSPD